MGEHLRGQHVRALARPPKWRLRITPRRVHELLEKRPNKALRLALDMAHRSPAGSLGSKAAPTRAEGHGAALRHRRRRRAEARARDGGTGASRRAEGFHETSAEMAFSAFSLVRCRIDYRERNPASWPLRVEMPKLCGRQLGRTVGRWRAVGPNATTTHLLVERVRSAHFSFFLE